MYNDWPTNAAVVFATMPAVCVSVLLHYEALALTSRGLARLGGRRRIKVLYAIASVLVVHVLDIWIFGLALWLLLIGPRSAPRAGRPTSVRPHLLLSRDIHDCLVRRSGTGRPDPVPRGNGGPHRLPSFTWSASFMYFEMQRFWRDS